MSDCTVLYNVFRSSSDNWRIVVLMFYLGYSTVTVLFRLETFGIATPTCVVQSVTNFTMQLLV